MTKLSIKKPKLNKKFVPKGYEVIDFRIPMSGESYIGYAGNDKLLMFGKKYEILTASISCGMIDLESCKGYRYIVKKVDNTIYPVYLHSDKYCESYVLAIKFLSETVCEYYMFSGGINTYKNSIYTFKELIKTFGYKIITKEEFDKIITPPVTYPVYLKSDKECEKDIAAVKFLSETVCEYHRFSGVSNIYNPTILNIEDLKKSFEYKVITEQEFNKLVAPPVTYEFPVYLKSDRGSETKTSAVKYISKDNQIFYYTDGSTYENTMGHDIETLMKNFGYKIITDKEFDSLTSRTFVNQIIQINGVSYKLVRV